MLAVIAGLLIGLNHSMAAPRKGQTISEVNLRTKPTTESASQGIIAKGTEVVLLSNENGWYKVEIKERTGYIREDFIRVTQEAETMYLAKGDKGEAVTQLQSALKKLGYFSGTVDGDFGDKTERAVIDFQTANKLFADGVAGPKTQELLYSGNGKSAPQTISATSVQTSSTPKPTQDTKPNSTPVPDVVSPDSAIDISQYNDSPSENDVEITAPAQTPSDNDAPLEKPAFPSASEVELIEWSKVDKLWKIGEVAWVCDVGTMRMYRLRRFGGINHADAEPLTKWDTREMYEIFGKKWTWTPRPVWIILPDGHVIAASTHDNPHMMSTIKNNGFDGHLCVHFLGSKTHNGNASYTATHQATVQEAWKATKK